MTTTKRKPRKSKHALQPFPWRVAVLAKDFWDDRDMCGIFDADDNMVAEYLFREDAYAIVATMNAKYAPLLAAGETQ